MMALMKDLQREGYTAVYADSAAALAISARKGSGKLRHINVGLLWIHERQKEEDLASKVLGTNNPADIMIKGVTLEILDRHAKYVVQSFPAGRAHASLEVQRGDIDVHGLVT